MLRFRGLCRRLAGALAAMAVSALVAPALGSAAPGALTQLSGLDGCVAMGGLSGLCTNGRAALQNAGAVRISPDGKFAYVLSGTANAVAVLARDPFTGALTQLAGTDGCVSEDGTGGDCADGKALRGPLDVAISSDGKFAYVSSLNGSSIAVFARNAATGVLTQLSGTDGCVSDDGTGGACVDGKGLFKPFGITISPDGKNVYLAGLLDNAVAVFSRNAATGVLTQLAGTDACVSESGNGGDCVDGKALAHPDFVTVSPDGKHVYVGSDQSDAVAVFSRSASGALTQLSGTDGCVSETGNGGDCVDGKALDGANQVAVSTDNKHAYVTSLSSGAVAVFARNATTGVLTQLGGTDGCISDTGTGGACVDGKALDHPQGITISADDKNVYVPAGFSSAVDVFARDAGTGKLTQLAGTEACVSENGSGGDCVDGKALGGAAYVALSPDGKRTYVASIFASAVAVFARAGQGSKATCTGTATGTAHNKPVVVALKCTAAPDGDPFKRSIVLGPAHGTLGPIDQKAGTVAYTPNTGYAGGDAFTFSATELDGTSPPATVTISVAAAPATDAGQGQGGQGQASSGAGDGSASSSSSACTRAAGTCPAGASGAAGPIASPVGPVTPIVEPAAQVVREALGALPSARRCVSRRNFRIRVRQPKSAQIAAAIVLVNGKTAATRRGARVTAPIDLRGLPPGRFTVKIRLLLADGRTVLGTRKYRTCTPKRRSGRRPPKV